MGVGNTEREFLLSLERNQRDVLKKQIEDVIDSLGERKDSLNLLVKSLDVSIEDYDTQILFIEESLMDTFVKFRGVSWDSTVVPDGNVRWVDFPEVRTFYSYLTRNSAVVLDSTSSRTLIDDLLLRNNSVSAINKQLTYLTWKRNQQVQAKAYATKLIQEAEAVQVGGESRGVSPIDWVQTIEDLEN